MNGRLLGATLLVSGTTIGAGMLALPVTTGLAGFYPSIILMVSIWLYMLITALFLLEVNLRMKGESNIISMVKKTLGKPGEIVAWIAYLLLLYSLTAAYIVGCSQIVKEYAHSLQIRDLPNWLWPLGLLLFFGSFVYMGTRFVDFFNRFLMLGLIISYLTLIGFGIIHIDLKLLENSAWAALFGAVPVVFTSFGYHIIIPTLSTYLDHRVKDLKFAIIVGSLIPLFVYILWQLVSLGIVPIEGESGLEQALNKGVPITTPLKNILNSPYIASSARGFAFFAIVTSFLGVALSLSDFLADGLKIEKNRQGRLLTCLLTFIPPFLFALFYPQGFILALRYAGIFVAILLGILPSLMAWFERYGKETERSFLPVQFKVPGGKPVILIGIIFACILIGIEFLG